MRRISLLKSAGVVIVLLFALLNSKTEISMSGNESSRFAVIQATGEQNVFHIEKTAFRTVDRVIRNNHIYSDKPLLFPWMLGMLWKIPHRLAGISFDTHYHLAVYLVNFFMAALTQSLLFLWLFNALRRNVPAAPLLLKWLLSLAMPLGGWMLSYSVVLNNHTPAALAMLGAFIAIDKFRRRPTDAAACLAGCAAGITGILDLPAGTFTGIAVTLAVLLNAPAEKRFRMTGFAISGGMIWLAALAAVNFLAYGTVLPLYISGTGGGTWAPPPASEHTDFYIPDVLFGTRGLFSYQPFLLFALLWTARNWKKSASAVRCMIAAATATTVFYIFFTNEYGGAAYGFRYLIVIIPLLWFLASCQILESHSKIQKSLAVLLIAAGMITGLAGSYNPFCIAFEGYRSPPGHFTRTIRSTFLGNLLCYSWETAPESALTRYLIDYYGPKAAVTHLYYSAFHTKKIDLLPRLQAYFAAEMQKNVK